MIAICKSSTKGVFNSSCGNELWVLFNLGMTLFGLCVWGEELVGFVQSRGFGARLSLSEYDCHL